VLVYSVIRALLFTVLAGLSFAGVASASPVPALNLSAHSSGASPGFVARSESANRGLRTSCPVGGAYSDAFDPADGYVYVANGWSANISIVKPPCTVVRTVTPSDAIFPYGSAYDPLVKAMVVTD
jgi:DNA-binding beta-propeller fold protein YncE